MSCKKIKANIYFFIASAVISGVLFSFAAVLAVDSNISGNLTVTGGITAAGQGVCLQNGTNCVSTSGLVPKDAWWGNTYHGSDGNIYLGYWNIWLSTELSNLTNGYASSAGYANSAGSAPASGGNSYTADGQHFAWSNRSNGPTYVWAADSNGDSYLAYRPALRVSYADSAGSASANGGTSSYSYLLYDAYRGGMHYSNDLYVSYAYNAGYANSAGSATDSTKVLKTGDTMSGTLTVNNGGTYGVYVNNGGNTGGSFYGPNYGVGGTGTGNNSTGVIGSGTTYGVYGTGGNTGGSFYGTNYGIGGTASNGTGVSGTGTTGVYGVGSTYGIGVYGRSYYGVYGIGIDGSGVTGIGSGTYAYGVNGTGYIGVYGNGTSYDFRGAHGEYTSGATWVNGSSRDLKENFTTVDNQAILNKIVSLPMTQWNYKTDKNALHVGPIAEDFYATFGLGDNNKSISTIDPSGVALVGVKALNAKIDAQQKQIEDQKNQNQQQQQQMDFLKAEIEALKNK